MRDRATSLEADASLSSFVAAGSSFALAVARFVSSPQRTSRVTETSNDTAALEPGSSVSRVHRTAQDGGAGGSCELVTVQLPPGKDGRTVRTSRPRGRLSSTWTLCAVAVPTFETVRV